MYHSRSRSRTPRPGYSRTPTVTRAEDILLGEGTVTEDTVEYLHEFVHPHHHHQVESTLVEEEQPTIHDDLEAANERASLPWWKRPSPWWIIVMLPLATMAMAATIAPRVEIYTMLACRVHKPDVYYESDYYISWLQDYRRPDNFTMSHNQVHSYGSVHVQTARANPCAADPVVQAAVAKLAAIMTACMGVLSCLTTGWWGSFSDRHGRIHVLGISVIGVLLTDVTFIIVYYYAERLPGNYWFLVIGPLVEGTLGGFASTTAAVHAYMADTSTSATRSRVFSLSMGLMFTGLAVGPTLGGVMIRLTHQAITVFWISSLSHLLYAFMVWFIIPESLSKRQRQMAIAKHNEQLVASASGGHTRIGFPARFKQWFHFLSPLAIFMPIHVRNLKGLKRDWNLLLVATCYAFTASLLGSYTYKFQYAASTFGWSSETLSYWISLTGAARAVHLAIILPICIKLFKRKPRIQLRASEEEPLIRQPEEATPARSRSHSPSRLSEPQSGHFDLNLARVSLGVEIISYTCMGLTSNALAFVGFGVMGALGIGFSPAIQALAMDLYTKSGGTETGKLFGALSVLQASQILGPAMYGLIYMNTVASYPRTIFFVSVATIFISVVALSLVRLPDTQGEMKAILDDVEEQPSPGGSLTREGTFVTVEDRE
ncbi:hypothetical protein WG66_011111 [Moniliophthora roreri]|uniref:MFS general substrate transporter n=1 Tax=Moniliophthora roreri TaxID=221103 RepID=A0A0W0FL65_MONRR|nr:hypothetical protein WG66_011111 [Moniliophthora roreri]